jgi:hypothetical protein
VAEIGIMIEGQEDLTWERLFRLAEAVEVLGFACLFRSDHLTSLDGSPQRSSPLKCWALPACFALIISLRWTDPRSVLHWPCGHRLRPWR